MGSATMKENVREAGTFGAEAFLSNAKRYADNRRLVDALSVIPAEEREAAIAESANVIAALNVQSEEGIGYTPPSDWGFGSDNAATIAAKVLGRSTSASKVRTLFAKKGK